MEVTHVGAIVRAWWADATADHIDAVDRMRALGLAPIRCCLSCPFEAYLARGLVTHRVRCDAYMYEFAAGTTGDDITAA